MKDDTYDILAMVLDMGRAILLGRVWACGVYDCVEQGVEDAF